MRWRGRRTSANVEDRRGRSGGFPVGRRGAGLGCGGLLIIIVLSMLFGADPQQLISVLEQAQPPAAQTPYTGGGTQGGPPQDELGQFASVVLADTEDTWNSLLGDRYREPKLVLFTDAVRSACGFNRSAVGPFYCPADSKVYLDLGFFNTLSQRFGAPGDFAQAYVIAHEVGHHIQNQLGISGEVQQRRRRVSQSEGNELSVRLELQADCLAGVWGHYANQKGMLEPGDIEEGLRAAEAIGDDMMQRRATGYVQPESWTHGSSEQRQQWLRRGLQTGDANQCDTFG
jgi:predicted metalloprotease